MTEPAGQCAPAGCIFLQRGYIIVFLKLEITAHMNTNENDFIFRPAASGDVTAILALYRGLAEYMERRLPGV
ncbi:MAG: hypothetical protein AB7F40_05255 [Victivallaceae bacterium]|nr:hypothetical protein [Victivallaceae bacterium]